MPWNNASELVVGNNGQVYVAPSGTPLPTTSTSTLNAAFVGLGYITEDGATVSITPEVSEYMAWQSRTAVRREKTSQQVQVSFSLLQWNESNVTFSFGGGSIAGSGPYSYSLPADDAALDERALVLDVNDGNTHLRWVFPRGNVVEAVEAQYNRGNPSALPITFRALAVSGAAPGSFYTDSTAFAAGS